MFTGLIEDVGRITAFERKGSAAVLGVSSALPVDDVAIGDSVAVNGACLTVISKNRDIISFDISPETISSTTFDKIRVGNRVNLERAMRLGDRLGGHIVTGHIDCIATLSKTAISSANRILEFTMPTEHARYLVRKGSVTIDGISLTVNNVSSYGFAVNIIPLTQKKTTLDDLKTGDHVNIETDIIGKYVERITQPWTNQSGLSMKTLAENGFI